jgi:hypothetical protein
MSVTSAIDIKERLAIGDIAPFLSFSSLLLSEVVTQYARPRLTARCQSCWVGCQLGYGISADTRQLGKSSPNRDVSLAARGIGSS